MIRQAPSSWLSVAHWTASLDTPALCASEQNMACSLRMEGLHINSLLAGAADHVSQRFHDAPMKPCLILLGTRK